MLYPFRCARYKHPFLSIFLLFVALYPHVPAVAVAKQSGCDLNTDEALIATMLINSPDQKRRRLVCSPLLQQVARERAQDMAIRAYFYHVNPDGHGPNFLIEEAGYNLPEWWGDEPAANYVESIAAGYSSGLTAWVAWMQSPSHSTHLLAQDPFYSEQIHYGIGAIEAPDSDYGRYYVVLTAP